MAKKKELTPEEKEWAKTGCKNNEEWHALLNREMWSEYCSGLDMRKLNIKAL